ncbi:MAG: tRNA preQ1(34) S-adenosylmethionine ribosyltransferase-isomerase QueA [Pseudomonadota bacterium]
MRVDQFDFDLPEARIALEPANPRDSARLLHVRGMACADHKVSDLPMLLRAGDLLVVNDTKVIPAQLEAMRPARAAGGGGDVAVSITLHKEQTADSASETIWAGFARPAKRLRVGDHLRFSDGALEARVIAHDGAEVTLSFPLTRTAFFEALVRVGMMPLPPYISRRRGIRGDDADHYQTHFARAEGSVAAPTAGLHFTPALVSTLEDRKVGVEIITLHVGAGTFLPVTADDVADHKMHAEWGQITPDQAARINSVRAAGGRVIAVGTTSLRLLETAALPDGTVEPFGGETDIFITPGYRFRAVDCLMTNFHLPRSTLFMLVCAFAGTDAMKNAYAHAIESEYRFYSYGDSSLLELA